MSQLTLLASLLFSHTLGCSFLVSFADASLDHSPYITALHPLLLTLCNQFLGLFTPPPSHASVACHAEECVICISSCHCSRQPVRPLWPSACSSSPLRRVPQTLHSICLNPRLNSLSNLPFMSPHLRERCHHPPSCLRPFSLPCPHIQYIPKLLKSVLFALLALSDPSSGDGISCLDRGHHLLEGFLLAYHQALWSSKRVSFKLQYWFCHYLV